MASKEQAPTARDDVYFFEPIFFKVEDTIFQIPRFHFARNEVFCGAFSLPVAEGVDTEAEGSSEAKPFELQGINKKDFRAFLKVLYPLDPHTHQSMAFHEWKSILALSDMWEFQSFRSLAIDKIDAKLNEATPLEKITMGEKYSISAWFLEGIIDLVKRDSEGPTMDEAHELGMQRAIHIYRLREMKLLARMGKDPTYNLRRSIKEAFGIVGGKNKKFSTTI